MKIKNINRNADKITLTLSLAECIGIQNALAHASKSRDLSLDDAPALYKKWAAATAKLNGTSGKIKKSDGGGGQ